MGHSYCSRHRAIRGSRTSDRARHRASIPIVAAQPDRGRGAYTVLRTAVASSAGHDSQIVSSLATILVLFLLGAVLYTHASTSQSTFEQIFGQFPLLSIFALVGLVVCLVADESFIRPLGVSIVALALLVGIGNEFLKYLTTLGSGNVFLSGLGDIGYKIEEYWCPFFMVMAAAVPIAMLAGAGGKSKYVAIAALLALVIYPWDLRLHVDDNYNEHSLAVEWGLELREPRQASG